MTLGILFWIVYLVLVILAMVLGYRLTPEQRTGAAGLLALFILTGILGYAQFGGILK